MMRLMKATTLLVLCVSAHAETRGYALGVGVSADNADGFTGNLLADVSFSDAASVSASLGTTRAAARPEDLRTREWSLGGRYDFGPLGIEVRGGQTGDPDDFDAEDRLIGIFHSGEHWRWYAHYLERDIDLVLRTALIRNTIEVSVPLEADGYRFGIGYTTDSKWRVSASYRQFDYDRDLSPLSGRFIVDRLTPTTLTLATSLLDDSTTLGIEMPLAKNRALSMNYAQDTLAGGLGSVDSLSVSFLTPVGERGDLDIALGASRGDDQFDDDTTVFLSVLYLFYGAF